MKCTITRLSLARGIVEKWPINWLYRRVCKDEIKSVKSFSISKLGLFILCRSGRVRIYKSVYTYGYYCYHRYMTKKQIEQIRMQVIEELKQLELKGYDTSIWTIASFVNEAVNYMDETSNSECELRYDGTKHFMVRI